MLGLGRNGLRKLASRRGLSSAAAQTSNTTSTPPPQQQIQKQSTDGRKNNFNKINKPFVVATPVEQLKLQKKYQENLESNKLDSLHEAVEYIEWRGTVFPQTVTKIVSLLERSSDLSTISDRQLAVLLSVFGATCDTLSRSIRAQHLEKVESILREKGVVLGLISRNQLIEAKVDNRSRVDAVEELGKFEESGVELDAKSYALLCEVYAKQANTKAITDIISHMKSSGIPLTEDHVAQLVYSVARSGNYGHVGRVVDTFSTSMNVVRLRCAAARAIAEREKNESGKGGFEITEMLRAIPTTAKLHSLENNVYVVNVLMDLIENGQFGAFNLLSSYLIVAESGTTLADNKLNLPVVARAKSLLSEGSLEEAIVLYSCVNPSYSNDFFVQNLNRQLENRLRDIDNTEALNEFLKVLTLAENKGLLPSANEFLLTGCSQNTVPMFAEIFDYVQQFGDIRSVFGQNPRLKKPIGRQLAQQLIKTVSPSEQAAIVAKIATVMFSPSTKETPEESRGFYQIMYKICGKDVKLVLPALDLMTSTVWHEKREFGTAIVQQLLRADAEDHLASEKLRILLESNKIGQLAGHRLHGFLTKFLMANKEKRVNLVAKILSYEFPPETLAKNTLKFGGRNVAKFLSNEIISVETAANIVNALEEEPRVQLSNEELADAKHVLKSYPEKAELLGKLKKSATMQRWRASKVSELLKELSHFTEESKEAVKLSLKRVILQKTFKEYHDDIDSLVNVLEQAVEWRKEKMPEALKTICKNLESYALSKAVSTNDLILADRIWQMRSGHLIPEVLLSYASRLFLNGEVERADEVCKDVRNSSKIIRPQTLEKMGRHLKGVESEKMTELAEYLKKSFNLSAKDARRVVLQAKKDQLNQLIERDDLAGALQMAIEETSTSGRAFGQIPLMIEAIKKNDAKTLQSVHTMVRSAHNQDMANVNLAYALIHSNNVNKAINLVERQNLSIESPTLQYFTTLASASENPILLKDLFIVFNGRASTLDLNNLLEMATRKLWSKNDMDSLTELSQVIESTSFPLQNKLRTFFDDLKGKNSTSSSVEFD
uniref:Leucine-rich PPR motif-containing protein, mitochondrial n=1 Tax=Caenorhabditis tropicalis TaxID=1561998 RepID=A0A1I7UVG0_9PELO